MAVRRLSAEPSSCPADGEFPAFHQPVGFASLMLAPDSVSGVEGFSGFPNLGRLLGYFLFSLIGFKRIIFRFFFQGVLRAIVATDLVHL